MEHSLGHLQRRSSEWNVGAETEWTEAGGGKEGDQGAQSQGDQKEAGRGARSGVKCPGGHLLMRPCHGELAQEPTGKELGSR